MNFAEDIYRAALAANVLLFLKDGQLGYKAPPGGIPDVLRQRILQYKADIVAFLGTEQAESVAQAAPLPPLVRASDRADLPVSRAQQRVWFAQEQSGDGSQFNIQGCFSFDGVLDAACFERAVGFLLQRHEVLRTTFVERGGQIVRAVQDSFAVPFNALDLTSRDAQSQSTEVRALIAADLIERFDLSRDPLLRVKLLRLSPQQHVAVFCMHHIASDGWTAGLLVEEFCATYARLAIGETVNVDADVLQYADFAAWQEGYLQGEVLDTGLSYWASALEGVPQVHSLPIDKQRPARQTSQGKLLTSRIDRVLADRIRAYCHSHKATLFMFLETAFAVLLSQYGSQNDIVVGTPVAGRPLPDTESAIGLFINTVALRCRVDPAQSFDDLLRINKSHILSAFAHQHVPFELVAERLNHRRSHSYSPVFQIWFVLQNNREVRFTLPGCAVSEYRDLPAPAAKYELNLYAKEADGHIELEWVFNSDVFDGRSIAYLSGEFDKLLERLLESPGKPCHDHGLFSANDVYAELTRPSPAVCEISEPVNGLLARFASHVAQSPHSPAVVTDKVQCTYRELDRLSDGYVLAIQRTSSSGRVGLLMDRGIDIVAAMLAALKLGRTYVPLDAGYPEARLRYMIAHAGCDLIVSDAASRELADSLAGDAALIVAPVMVAPTHLDIAAEQQAGQGSAPAYILYTSGSTGHPKGVYQSRANLAYHAGSYADALELSGADKVLQLASFNFDASVLDTHGALLAGAAVHLADIKATTKEALLSLIQGHGITVYHSTPTVFKYLFGDSVESAPSQIRCVVLGGEPVDALTMRIFRRVFGRSCRLIGLYGATESSLTTLGEVSIAQIDAGLHPGIGHPIPGMQVQVHRADGSLARVYETGQIVIRSHYLAEGYWEAPELTSEKFRIAAGSEREYATGDTGYLTPDGDIRFVGRLDFQVKLNGIRIETGEIESILQLHGEVTRAAVVIRQVEGDDATLVACIVSRPDAPKQDPAGHAESEQSLVANLRAHLRQWLPDYMVPGRFLFVDGLPQTPSGKIDRRQLLGMLGPAPSTVHTAPRDPLEQRLADLWCEILHLDAVGIHDDFFMLGGHSLKAMRLLGAIEQSFGVAIPMKVFFDNPCIEGCAKRVREGHPPDVERNAMPKVEADPDAQFAPFPLTLIQQAYWLGRSDVFELGDVATQSYAEAVVPVLCVERLTLAFNRLIARHEMLRAIVTPTGEQVILEHVPGYAFPVIDLRESSPEEIAVATECLRDDMATQVLPIGRWPIFDLRVSLLPNGCGRLHALTDAITLDAKSRSILARELSALYADIDHDLPAVGLSFRDYVLAAQRIVDTPAYAVARAYWHARIDRLPAAPDLPLSATAPAAEEGGGIKRYGMVLERDDWVSLKSKASRHRLTPANVLLAVYAEVLALWSKSSHFCLNLTLFNRHQLHDRVDDVVGVFTSSIPLEVNLGTPGSFAHHAARIRDQLWSDMEHRHFSGIEVLREMNSRRGTALGAQLPVVFTSTVGLNDYSAQGDAVFTPDHSAGASRSRTSQVFLDCQVAEHDNGATIVWNGMEMIFPPNMLNDMFETFRARVLEILDCRGASLPDTQLELPPSHRTRRGAINATATPRAEGELLHHSFARRVTTHGDKVAIAWRDGSMTYAELDGLSNALARRLRATGVGVNQLVAVVAEKGWRQAVAVLAVLKAGGAYLPIDPDIPEQRRHQLLEQAEVKVAMTEPHLEERLAWPNGMHCISIVREQPTDAERAALSDVQTSTDLAYVIFTSGSTGVPKGVAIDHRGAVNTIEDINRRFAVTDRDAVLALSALNFDLSVYDIFGLLAVGGTIVYPAPALERDPLEWTRLVETFNVTIWNTVPALAQMWVDSLDERSRYEISIRVVMMSGDWIPTGLPARIRHHFPAALQYSLGGATEASIWSIYYPIADVAPGWSSIPYGRPMENQTFHVKKADFRDCPDGVPGDLYIGGIGLAKGYWKDREKTDAAFVVCPRSGERLYKTGDLGRYLPDGNIEFLGREDSQVKINGYRIELGEIEAAMVKHPKVKLAIAAAVGERNRAQLVAYVMLEEAVRKQLSQNRSAIELLSAEVQQSIRDELPAYMMPAAFVLIEEVPLTANGKVDRKALPVPEANRDSARTYTPPTNEVEVALCQIWEQQLRLERVGIEDNFFELGGDSLMASRTVGLIRNRFGLGDQFRMRSIFEAPTIRSIAMNVSACLDVRAIEETLHSFSNEYEEVEDGLI